ncbi:LuxR C-terminal-related transcriptional regulator [Euzebya rosea]|uniref:LuxR C-terminal-related transcriptional regulator n=1 Tax=Euzebya rosea TaxID=2052804 RepID=UPI0013009C9A|nr:LuxR C-terminal-related transcriptional regulator [Euzebya rosea]
MHGATGVILPATKFSPPTLSDQHVTRSRLHRRLDDLLEPDGQRVGLVSAPAGSGKSTLLAGWLAERPEASAWLQVDRFDNDPARFWASVVGALAAEVPGLDAATGPALAAAAADEAPVVARLVNALSAHGGSIVLVIDDLHLITQLRVMEGLAYLISLAPPQLRIVLATRVDPALGLARLRLTGGMTELRAADLRFEVGEAAGLLATGVDGLTPSQLDTLCQRTEGWAAGLVLAGMSLAVTTDLDHAVAAFQGDDRLVVEYLSAELLSGLSLEDRDRLLRTSILDRMCGPLVDAVCGSADGTAWLRRLASRNQMVVSLDRTGTWYRYHHLLGDLLRLEADVDLAAELPAIHRAAAEWHESDGSPHEAVEHRVGAGDHVIAVDLLWDHAPVLMNRGQLGTVLGQLERLGSAGRDHPRALLVRSWISLFSGRQADAWRHLDRARALDLDAEEAGQATALSIMRGLADGDVSACLAEVAASGPTIDSTHAMTLGGALVWAGRHEDARPLLQEAAARAADEEHLFVAAVTPVLQAIADIEQGDEASAAERASWSIRFAEDNAMESLSQLALAHSIVGRTAEAPDERLAAARRGVALARTAQERVTLAHALASAGDVLCELGEPDGPELLREARAVVDRCVDPGIVAPYLARVESRHALTTAPVRPAGLVDAPTEREAAVLRYLPTNLSQRQIAEELFVSLNTVKTHTRSLYRKLGVSDRKQAIQAARDHGLL